MKRFLYVVMVAVSLISCGSGNSYKIRGKVPGVDNGTVVTLNVIQDNDLVALDSAVVAKEKFTISGETDTCLLAILTFEDEEDVHACTFFLENGTIDIEYDIFDGSQTIGGTVNNDAFQAFYKKIEVLNDKANEVQDKMRMTAAAGEDYSSFVDEMSVLQDNYKDIVTKSIVENTGNVFGFQQLLDSYEIYEPDEILGFLDMFEPRFGTNADFSQLKGMMQVQMMTAVGHPCIDFELPLLNRKYETPSSVKLSDYIAANKVVLLDFWASWCTPCRNEIPNMKAAYEKFKSKGFEIVSVSVDDERDEWIQAVKDDGMTWPQLLDTNERETSAAYRYSVTAIPSTFLIDADGTIIGRNLRGGEVAAALEDYFKD